MSEYPTYLIHYGIEGQKWGVRRFQNEDGTWTEDGLIRRRKDQQHFINKQSKIGQKFDRYTEKIKRDQAAGKKISDRRVEKAIKLGTKFRSLDYISKDPDTYLKIQKLRKMSAAKFGISAAASAAAIVPILANARTIDEAQKKIAILESSFNGMTIGARATIGTETSEVEKKLNDIGVKIFTTFPIGSTKTVDETLKEIKRTDAYGRRLPITDFPAAATPNPSEKFAFTRDEKYALSRAAANEIKTKEAKELLEKDEDVRNFVKNHGSWFLNKDGSISDKYYSDGRNVSATNFNTIKEGILNEKLFDENAKVSKSITKGIGDINSKVSPLYNSIVRATRGTQIAGVFSAVNLGKSVVELTAEQALLNKWMDKHYKESTEKSRTETIEDLKKHGIYKNELSNAKQSRIKSLLASGKTQEDVARMLGVSASTVNKYK